jgi:hypothetical protein
MSVTLPKPIILSRHGYKKPVMKTEPLKPLGRLTIPGSSNTSSTLAPNSETMKLLGAQRLSVRA